MKSKGKHTPTHTLSHLQLIQTLLTPETVVTLTGLSTGDVTGPQSRSQQVQTTNGPGPDRQLTADHLTLVSEREPTASEGFGHKRQQSATGPSFIPALMFSSSV